MHRFLLSPLLSLSLALCAMPAHAADVPLQEPPGALTLPTALALAMRANPELSAARHEVAALAGAALQAQARPNPELAVLFEDQTTRTSTLQLNQLIELGGKRDARIRLAGQDREAGDAALVERRADTRAAVIVAFFDLLAAQQGLRLADTSTALAERTSAIAARRVVAGKASPVEETRSRVVAASVRLELNLARSALAGARKRLAASWGNPAPVFDVADGRLDVLPAMPSEQTLQTRLEQAPAILKARSELARRGALLDIENRRRMPDVTVSVGIKRQQELGRNQAIVGLALPLPLFDQNRGNRLDALRRGDKAGDELAAARLRTQAELDQAQQRLAGARHEVQALQDDILPGAQSAFEAASKGFEFGKFAFLDVLDARRTLLQASTQHLRALLDAHKAATEIERILGVTTESTP